MAKRRQFHLRIALPVVFAVFVGLTGIAVFTINFYFSIQSLDRVSYDYLDKTSEIILEKTVAQLSPAARFAQVNGALLSPEQYEREFFSVFNTITIPQFSAYEQFALIYFGNTDGDFWLNGIEPDRTVQTQVIDRKIDGAESDAFLRELQERPADSPQQIEERRNALAPYLETAIHTRNAAGQIVDVEPDRDYIYDPRWRPWYENAVASGQASWSSVYTFSSSGQFYASGKVGVTVSSPVYSGDNGLLGVVGIDIVLEELDAFLKSLVVGQNGRAFLFTADGRGVAYGALRVPEEAPAPEVLQPIAEVADPAVRAAVAELRMSHRTADDGEVIGGLTDREQYDVHLEGGKHLAAFAPLPGDNLPQWIVGIVVPQDDFVGELKSKYLITVLVSLATLALVIVAALYISHMITAPIKLLTAEADRIRNLELDGAEPGPSPFTELNNMTSAFSNMKSGIRSFKKYIPSDVVTQLIRSGQEAVLGGSTQEVSIFFSDVADFTATSEQLSPNQLVTHLGDYLGWYSTIIAETGGTVDKYIGDAIMAFWNAPTRLERHSHAACRAALRCVEKLAELRRVWKQNGLPPLNTRIGLHVGDVVVGNMGSEERLNYTVIGDAVNLSSRLEGLAKVYGVRILVSDEIYERTRDEFRFRRLDRVTVKGKTVPVTVYELVCERHRRTRKLEALIYTYERGLHAYFRQEWDAAQKDMNLVLKHRPADRAAAVISNRIAAFRHKPPGAEWDGVAAYTSK